MNGSRLAAISWGKIRLVPDPRVPDHPVLPITFAHRGARAELSDNTLPAFRRARELGARGLESDVRVSADGEAVLVHDAVVNRGRLRRRRVAVSTARELAEVGVPRLADLYADLGTDYELSLDVNDLSAGEAMLDVAAAAGALERLWVCSSQLELLESLGARAPAAHLVHSTRRRSIRVPLERHAAELDALGFAVLNMHHTEWTAGLVGLFHRFGVLAFAWDVQEVRHLRAML